MTATERDRKTYLGGHDIAAICGKSEWRTPMDVWLEKTGKAKPFEMNERMQWGTLLEQIILQEWGKRSGMVVAPGGFWRDPKEPWRGGTIDGVGRPLNADLHPSRILEAKAVGMHQLAVWEKQIPIDYQYQAQHYLALYGFNLCTYPVLFGGQRLLDFHLEADAIVQHEIATCARDFWHTYVLPDKPPPGESIEHAGHLFGTRECTPSERQALGEIARLRALSNSVEGQLKTQLEQLKEWARDVTLTCNGKVLAEWKDVTTKPYSVPSKQYRSLNIARFSSLAKALNIDLAPNPEEQ